MALVLFLPLLQGCLGPHRTPNLQRIFADANRRTGKRPIIVIPGILGSQLVNRKTGEVVWPSLFRSSDDGLALPVSADLAANSDNLEAQKIIDIARLKLARLGPEIYIYRELLEALSKYGGYREGDWTNPGADGDHDTYYVYPYDWRRDNVETAREFVRQLEALKRRLNNPELRFNVVAHSMGGLIARYAARYGDADLAPEGTAPRVNWAGAAHINKIILFGTPNEGSAEAFATVLEGFSVTEGMRRRIPLLNKLSREDAFTAPSIFQLMPHSSVARFLDEELRPLKIDLYDPAVWRYYGWSPVTDPDYRERFVKGKTRGDDAPFRGGSLDNLDAYFSTVLNRARRFQEALDVPVDGTSPVALLAFGGDCEETLDAPIIMLDRKTNRWLTLIRPREYRTANGRRIKLEEVSRAMYAPGDGRVTRASLLAENFATAHRTNPLYDSSLPIVYAVFGCDLHSNLQNNRILQDNALTALISETLK
ncbi:MAG TPA: hypothetical protein VGB17_11400 [Pyrinomonadaceae bacterium]|jgi:pimeloyl-ACP methyl ester carboxylesterase